MADDSDPIRPVSPIKLAVTLYLDDSTPDMVARCLREMQLDIEDTLIDDFGPEAWGGYDGARVLKVDVVRDLMSEQMNSGGLLRTQYAVRNTTKRIIDRGLYEELSDAQEELERLYAWKENRRLAAERNEASGFEGGNGDWYYWNRGDLLGGPPTKDYEWDIVSRQATPWTAIVVKSASNVVREKI